MLTKGDDYPLHQTAEPVAYAGTDRNFYDRYFFNGYEPSGQGDAFFAAAFGVYPHLNIADAAFCWMKDGRQVNLHASRWLGMERMDLAVGPISIEVVEPLRRLTVRVEAPDQGIRAEVAFEGRSFPIEEPRFTRRMGPRTLLDYTRLTQNGRYAGWVEADGVRHDVSGFVGTRDRSWGVRPVGARDAQDLALPAPPQFFWLWSPCVFPEGDLFFHTNDDEHGRPWNRRAVWAPLGSGHDQATEFETAGYGVDWRSGTRHATAARLSLPDGGEVTIAPTAEFFMLGLGYGHPVWGHGLNHGAAVKVEREDLDLASLDRTLPFHLHVQALSTVTWRAADGTTRVGRGVFEQLALGPHAPSGFAGVLDMAR
ncbi:MAG: hypothetical protein J7521_01735 [Caulobacter sp.]|nr:hypothetical protein [Caulobacter sp.]